MKREAAPDAHDLRALLRDASLELARLRRIRGAHRRTWRRIARARARLAFAAALLGASLADPAAAEHPMFRHGFVLDADPSDHPKAAFADLDGDGDLDVVTGAGSGRTSVVANTGTATQAAFAAPLADPFGLVDVGSRSAHAFGDLDDDGDLDALVGNRDGDLVFFPNTGSATAPAFAAPSTNLFGLSDVGNYADPELADVDGDGDLDVFTVGAAFLENTGSASVPAFAAPVTNPFGVAGVPALASPDLADLDGDGDLDLFVSPYSAGDALFFENSGSITTPAFGAPQPDPFGLLARPQAGADFGDVDADGDLDAILTGSGIGTSLATAFENTGTATAPAFTSLGNSFGLGVLPERNILASHALVDIDGDGDLDAFSADTVLGIRFFRNTGSASFPAFAADPPNPFGLTGIEAASVDVDADGDVDVFLGRGSGETVLYTNTGSSVDPAFAGGVTNPFGLATVSGEAAPAFHDLDGDGDLDALIGSANGDLAFFANSGTASAPAFAAPLVNPFGLAQRWGSASADLADTDGDGDLDAFVGDSAGVSLFVNTGTQSAPAFFLFATTTGDYHCPELADVDGDGDLDLFLGRSDGAGAFRRNTGTVTAPAFVPGALSLGGVIGGSRSAPDLADLDGDGDLDALVANLAGDVVFRRNGGTPTQPVFGSAVAAGLDGLEPSFVDIDADGDLDAFASEIGDTLFSENTGTASAPAFAALETNPFGLSGFATVTTTDFADLDADGDLDAVLGAADGTTSFAANTGSAGAPAFASPQPLPGLADVGDFASPELGDVDGDGDLDAFIGASAGNTMVFRNSGSANAPAFAAAAQTTLFGLADVGDRASPELADLDGDGDLDLVVSDALGRAFFFETVGFAAYACEDGFDNDGDGRIDFGNDAGCTSEADASELSTKQCDNGLDDDGDGFVDAADPHCTGPLDDRELPTQPGAGCGLGPELALLVPLLAALRARRRSG